MEGEAEVKDEAQIKSRPKCRQGVAGGPFPPQKGDHPLWNKGGVNPSLPRRLDTFLLRKEVDESGPFLSTQKVVVLT